MVQSYHDFTKKLAKFPLAFHVSTNMQHLHDILNESRARVQADPLPDIRDVRVIDSDDVKAGIEELAHIVVMGLAMGDGEPFSDITNNVHVARVAYSTSRYGDVPEDIDIDLAIVCCETMRNNEHMMALLDKIRLERVY